nr:hypothetical protein Iba_chr14bCG7550 [Ipomoea batatas]GMD93249.1 hypothetical protein Iba_chr14fCG5600 [Ipomoea batatas]
MIWCDSRSSHFTEQVDGFEALAMGSITGNHRIPRDQASTRHDALANRSGQPCNTAPVLLLIILDVQICKLLPVLLLITCSDKLRNVKTGGEQFNMFHQLLMTVSGIQYPKLCKDTHMCTLQS